MVDPKTLELADYFWRFTPPAKRYLNDQTEPDRMEVMALAQAIQKVAEEWLEQLQEREKIVPACKHRTRGLCLDCWDDYQEDPEDWVEWGNHAKGDANHTQLQAEMATLPPETEPPADLPY